MPTEKAEQQIIGELWKKIKKAKRLSRGWVALRDAVRYYLGLKKSLGHSTPSPPISKLVPRLRKAIERERRRQAKARRRKNPRGSCDYEHEENQ